MEKINFNDKSVQACFLELASELSQIIIDYLNTKYHEGVVFREKSPGNIVSKVDIEIEQIIFEYLQQSPHLAGCGFYGEEGANNRDLAASYAAVVDGLDGTSNFARKIPIFASSVALLHDNEVVFGLLVDPINREYWVAMHGQGVWRNNIPYTREATADADQYVIHSFGRGNGDLKHDYQLALQNGDTNVQRNFSEWCPVAHFLLFLRGYSNLIIMYEHPIHDAAAGILLCHELGYTLTSLGITLDHRQRYDPITGYISAMKNKTNKIIRRNTFSQVYSKLRE